MARLRFETRLSTSICVLQTGKDRFFRAIPSSIGMKKIQIFTVVTPFLWVWTWRPLLVLRGGAMGFTTDADDWQVLCISILVLASVWLHSFSFLMSHS